MKVQQTDIQEIKSRVTIQDLLMQQGIELKPSGSRLWCRCMLHNEKTPSFSIDPNKQIWHCMGCGAGGDIVKLTELMYNYSFREAVAYLARLANIQLTSLNIQQDTSKPVKPARNINLEKQRKSEQAKIKLKRDRCFIELYNTAILANREASGTYLTQRGISLQTQNDFNIGLCKDWIHPDQTKAYPSNRLIIPRNLNTYLARAIDPSTPKQYSKRVVGFQQDLYNYPMSWDNKASSKYKYQIGDNRVKASKEYAYTELYDTGIVYVTEGEIDTISIAEALGVDSQTGYRYYNLVGICSDNNASVFIKEAIKARHNTYILLLDQDTAGQKATEEIKQALKAENISYIIPSYKGKDINEALLTDREDLVRILKQAYEEAKEYVDTWYRMQI